MKPFCNTRLLRVALIGLALLTTIAPTGCQRDACKTTNCKNMGTCTNGSCTCPTGYSGQHCENSSINFANNTYTPVTITVNGASYTIANGRTMAISAPAGTTAAIAASTRGADPDGNPVGRTMSWSFTDTFPSGGHTATHNLDVAEGTYFYLQLINASQKTIRIVKLTYPFNSTTVDTVLYETIPNDGKKYGLGYYPVNDGTINVAAHDSMGYAVKDWLNLEIPYTANAELVLLAN